MKASLPRTVHSVATIPRPIAMSQYQRGCCGAHHQAQNASGITAQLSSARNATARTTGMPNIASSGRDLRTAADRHPTANRIIAGIPSSLREGRVPRDG